MFRVFSPEVIILALGVAGILKLIPSRKQKPRHVDSNWKSEVSDEESMHNNISRMQRVVDEHSDCTAEVVNMCVLDYDRAKAISRLTPGDRVDLKLADNTVSVYVDSRRVGDPQIPHTSRLRQILTDHIDFEAYLGGRDIKCCTKSMQFVSIIVFYKINGVPPTEVKLE